MNNTGIAGTKGIQLGQGVKSNSFIMADVENCAYALYLTGVTGTHEVSSNQFISSYLTGGTSAIYCGAGTSGNSFRDIQCSIASGGSSSAVIIDEASNTTYEPNSYENIAYGTPTWTVTVGNGIFKGFSGGSGNGVNYFSNQGTSKQNGNGLATRFSIPHGIVGTPRFYSCLRGASGLPEIQYLTVDATNIYVNFTSPPLIGSNNVVLVWSANL